MNGSYIKDPSRENKSAIVADGITPGVPKEVLLAGEYAIEKWRDLVETLKGAGVLSTTDGDLMSEYCIVYHLYRVSLAKLLDDDSADRRNVADFHKYSDRLLKILPQFGLTPASRGMVSRTKPTEADPLQDYLGKTG